MSETKKPFIIYHAQCADGAGAAYAAWRKFSDDAEYLPARYGDPVPSDVAGREVYVLDFSYSPKEMLDLQKAVRCQHAGSLLMIDHHKSAWEKHQGLDYAMFDLSHSGAVLAWNHFHPHKSVPKILHYIEDRDLWKWSLPRSREVSAALDVYGVAQDFRSLVDLAEAFETSGGFSLIANEGAAYLRQQARYVDQIASLAQVVCGFGNRLHYVANASILQSEVGNVLAARAGGRDLAPMAAVWFQTEDGRYKVSLRSVGDFDVSKIAERYGGGGHLNAASFYCNELPWL